jgi:hypothetical protein
MSYFVLYQDLNKTLIPAEWHIPNSKPYSFEQLDKMQYSIYLLQADGHELDHINSTFDLPYSRKSVVGYNPISKWRGKLAEFIYDNL